MELQISIEARGYGATKNPTQLEELSFCLRDYLMFLLVIAVFLVVIYVNSQ